MTVSAAAASSTASAMSESRIGMSRVFYDRLDPRTRDWLFIGDPRFSLVVCGGYLVLTYVVMPRFMKNRAPFDLRWAIRLHNLFMVLANAFFMVEFAKGYYRAGYNPLCQGMTYATDENSIWILRLGWWYLMVRSLDFLDTFFFLLRKKFDHVTFQHVSHHFCCVFSGHVFLSVGMDGQPWFGLTLNIGIHVVMYTYYFLASFGPRMKPYLWWKKHLTTAQIAQHCIIIVHGLIPCFYECGYPMFLIQLALPQGLLGLALFINFYAVSYTGKKSWADIFSAAPCILSDDNDPLKFKKLQEAVARECKTTDENDNKCDAVEKQQQYSSKPFKSD